MTVTTEPVERFLSLASSMGARFWAEGESIRYRSPVPLTAEVRELVAANKPTTLARLALWDGAEASRLESETDGLVEQLNVSGHDAVIKEAASACVKAHMAHDMNGVRKQSALVEDRARTMAGEQQPKRAA